MERKTIVLLGLCLIGLGIVVMAVVFLLAPPVPNEQEGTGQTTTPTVAPTTTPAGLRPSALDTVVPAVQGALDRLDRATADAAAALGPTDMTGSEARAVLRILSRVSPAAIDATAVSSDGIMLTVEPAEYASAEGADISGQEQVQRLRATRKPVMSRVFATVEGVNATDLEHPVLAPSGTFNGSASLLFNPSVLLTIAIQESLGGSGGEVFVIDTDGIVLYDRDAAEIGTNTFTDAMYSGNAELIAIAGRMRTETEGTGSYTFAAEGSPTPVRKTIAWASAGLHGTEWRMVVVTSTAPA